MIIGNGLIASLFKNQDTKDVVFFASGVSNSSETKPEEFLREENLIKKTIEEHPGNLFIYFSTCSIYDSSKTGSDYVLHKLKMEQIIKNSAPDYLILRVSNAVGSGGNPNLLLNYLVKAIKKGDTINVHTKAHRNLIDAEDVKNITKDLIQQKSFNRIVNIAYPANFSIVEILELLERHYETEINLNLIKSGSAYVIEIPEIERYFHQAGLTNKEEYLKKLLQKYYR